MKRPLLHRFVMPLCAAAVCLAGTLQAATLAVDWGGNYVSSYQQLLGTPTTGAGSITYRFSDTTPWSPTGPDFYGGVTLINGSGTGTPAFTTERMGLWPMGTGDSSLRFGATASSGTLAMYGMIFFKKEDFINGAAGQTITFDSDSYFQINVTSSSAGSASGGVNPIRRNRAAVYALRDGQWGWYVSSLSLAGQGQPQRFENLSAMMWAPYDPTGAQFPAVSTADGFQISGTEFQEIEALGFVFQYVTAAPNASISFFLDGFEAQVAAIPEPSTAAALVGGGLLLVGARRYIQIRR